MFENIINARKRLSGFANKTPVFTSSTLNGIAGANIFLKCENFQKMGAFKFRGAFNSMSKLSDTEKAKGVITFSSGNHAQAVALVGKMLDIQTTIIMPSNAPATKLSATKDYGAIVVEYDPEKDAREDITATIQKKEGQTLIPPFDHPDVIAGQGTAALELFDQVDSLDMILTPCGGGGLLSGTAIAAKGRKSDCVVIGVEPEVADDAVRSFKTGTLQYVKNPPTIADGTRTSSLGKITFPLVLKYVDDMITVSEDEIIKAIQFLFYRMKLVVEPSGALGVAALLTGKITPGKKTGVILSGGNIDAKTIKLILDS